MRKLFGLLVGGVLMLAVPSLANAALLNFSGTVSVSMGSIRAIDSMGTGVATVNNSSGLGHLSTLRLAGGISMTATSSILITDPSNVTITKVIGQFGNGTGTLAPISGGGPLTLNTLPLTGSYKVCILLAGCSSFFTVPMQQVTPSGTVGIGIGGYITANAFGAGFRFSAKAAPWTIQTGVITGVTSYNDMIPPLNRGTFNTSETGYAHGPASATSTANIGGVIQVVSPTLITTNLMKPNQQFGLPITMALEFVPEPGSMLLLASGVAGLVLLGWRRRIR